MKSAASLGFVVAVLTASGCASIAVTDEAIVDRTAFALGLNKGEFTVSNRVDEGTTTQTAASRAGARGHSSGIAGPSAGPAHG